MARELMTIHVNLLSAQLIPNVIPILSSLSDVKKIYLVTAGATFHSKAQLLKDFYHSKGVEDVEVYECEDPNDYYSLRHKAKDLYKDIKAFYPSEFVVLNSTGGTKPMSLAFTLEFDKLDESSMPIYTDSINKRVVILNDNEKLKHLPYYDVLGVQDYFHLNSFDIDYSDGNDESISERESLTKELISIAGNNPGAISYLNMISQKTNFNTVSQFNPIVILDNAPRGAAAQLLTTAQSYGLLTFSDKVVEFKSLDDVRYLAGGWLEELAFLAAKEAGINKALLNVTGKLMLSNLSGQDVNNEFDVVLMNNNQMLILEAKTTNWKNQEGKGQEATVKLDSLTKLYGGAFAQGRLISVHPLTERIQQRIEHMPGIDAFQVSSFDALVQSLANWKKKTEA